MRFAQSGSRHGPGHREGQIRSIPANELVPGDLVQIEAGDRIPADARLIYSTGLQTQEAALTGESTPVTKSIEPMAEAEVPLGDRRNMVYTGTIAVSGKAQAIVVTTGIHTELGKIAALIHKASEAKQEDTPLQRRLQQLGHTLLWLSLGIVLVVFLLASARRPLFTSYHIGKSRGGRHPRRVAGRRHHHAGTGSDEDGEAARAYPTPLGRRDARLDQCDLLRQDRDADKERDDSHGYLPGR